MSLDLLGAECGFQGDKGRKVHRQKEEVNEWDVSTIKIQGRPERLTRQEFCNVRNNAPKVSSKTVDDFQLSISFG